MFPPVLIQMTFCQAELRSLKANTRNLTNAYSTLIKRSNDSEQFRVLRALPLWHQCHSRAPMLVQIFALRDDLSPNQEQNQARVIEALRPSISRRCGSHC